MKLVEMYIIVPKNDNCSVLCLHKNGNHQVFNKGDNLPEDYIKMRFDTKKQAEKYIIEHNLNGYKSQKIWTTA